MNITEVDSGRMVPLSGNEQKSKLRQLSNVGLIYLYLHALSSN